MRDVYKKYWRVFISHRRWFIICLSLIATFGLSGCRGQGISTREKPDSHTAYTSMSPDTESVIDRIRYIVIEKSQSLSEEDENTILESAPVTGLYKMGRTYGQFLWTWDLPNGRNVTADYTGDIASPIGINDVVIFFSGEN